MSTRGWVVFILVALLIVAMLAFARGTRETRFEQVSWAPVRAGVAA